MCQEADAARSRSAQLEKTGSRLNESAHDKAAIFLLEVHTPWARWHHLLVMCAFFHMIRDIELVVILSSWSASLLRYIVSDEAI